jgi:dual specificity protein kinase YAK1
MRLISLRVTLHNSSKSPLLLLFLPQARQIPSVHLVGLFRPSPRVREPTKMPLLTTSTLPSIRLLRLRRRRHLRQRTMFFATRTSRRNYSRSHPPPRTLLPPATRGTRIRNHRHRNMRRPHKVRSVHLRASLSVLTSHLAGSNNGSGAPQQASYSSGSNVGVASHLNPNPPSNAYYPNSRTRANTINHMDRIPPALARLQHMSQDVIGGRNALTPVLNRDDAIKEWERRQSGKAATAQPYPQLEYLQQQAELVGVSGIASWQQPGTRYQPTQSSALAHQYHPPAAIVVDDERRDAIMSNVRATAQGQNYISSNTISNPPAAYTGAPTTAGSRFAVTYPQQPPAGSQSQSQQLTQPPLQQQQQQQSPTSPFDSLDRRPDMGGLFVPLQPDHFQSYAGASVAGARGAAAPPQPTVQPSFYDPAVAQQTNAAPQRNPFSGEAAASSGGGGAPGGGGTNTTKDRRGSSGMEFWPR